MAHDLVAALGVALARWRDCIAARDELVGCEGAGMAAVGIEGDEERRKEVRSGGGLAAWSGTVCVMPSGSSTCAFMYAR